MPNPAPPSRRLQRRIAAGELRADRAQLAAARELDQLHRALAGRGRGGNWRAQLDRIKRAIHRGPRQNQTQGVYLWGGVGSGKTMLMDAFHAALPAGLSRRIHFHRFMQSAHDARAKLRDRQDPLTVIAAQWAARHRVLCLDEFSVTDITDAMLLSGLLRGLFDAGVTVLATSNTRPDDLYRGGLQRQRFLPAIALIQARMRVLRVDGGRDYRLDCLAAGALYHTPHDQHAMRAMRRSFARLEGGGGGGDGAGDSGEHGDGAGDGDSGDYGDGAGVLGDINGDGTGNGAGDTVAGETHFQLCGRAVDAVAIGRGVAWFRFDQLCGDARSKTDYIELARRFHTLLLSDIPRLDADADDAARRFIELVDELYDRGVNLIASAAAPPADLYRGRRLRAPFARAASRLREMNSRDYLARPHAQTARGRRKR
ncbi:MAG: cell division protein ZapE [Gammaproteobacteria bacterium]|nr:cell division protein ZapE [Gammaproteobacteria bacterium]